MSGNKDYSKLTPEELSAEKKKIKNNERLSALLIGFLVGVMIFGIVKKGIGFLHIFLPLLLISGIYKNSLKLKQHQKQIETELNAEKPEK